MAIIKRENTTGKYAEKVELSYTVGGSTTITGNSMKFTLKK
jgi:hypothetical protein